MTPATMLGVWANLDDEAYLWAGLIAEVREGLAEHRGVRRSYGHAGSTSRSSAARAGPLVTEVGRSARRRELELHVRGGLAPDQSGARCSALVLASPIAYRSFDLRTAPERRNEAPWTARAGHGRSFEPELQASPARTPAPSGLSMRNSQVPLGCRRATSAVVADSSSSPIRIVHRLLSGATSP